MILLSIKYISGGTNMGYIYKPEKCIKIVFIKMYIWRENEGKKIVLKKKTEKKFYAKINWVIRCAIKPKRGTSLDVHIL